MQATHAGVDRSRRRCNATITLVGELPELCWLSHKQVAALICLVPFAVQSGMKKESGMIREAAVFAGMISPSYGFLAAAESSKAPPRQMQSGPES